MKLHNLIKQSGLFIGLVVTRHIHKYDDLAFNIVDILVEVDQGLMSIQEEQHFSLSAEIEDSAVLSRIQLIPNNLMDLKKNDTYSKIKRTIQFDLFETEFYVYFPRVKKILIHENSEFLSLKKVTQSEEKEDDTFQLDFINEDDSILDVLFLHREGTLCLGSFHRFTFCPEGDDAGSPIHFRLSRVLKNIQPDKLMINDKKTMESEKLESRIEIKWYLTIVSIVGLLALGVIVFVHYVYPHWNYPPHEMVRVTNLSPVSISSLTSLQKEHQEKCLRRWNSESKPCSIASPPKAGNSRKLYKYESLDIDL